MEGPHPDFIEFPNAEWAFFDVGQYHLVYRRPETTQALERLRAKFSRPQWMRKWSEKNVADVMATAISKSMGNPTADAVLAAMSDAAAELDAEPPRQRVIVAVGGARVLQEVKFGVIRLFQMDDAEHAILVTAFDRIIDSTRHSKTEQEELKQRTQAMLQPLRGSACLEVLVEGDAARAEWEASAESEPVLDILQVIAAIEEPSVKRIRIVPGGPLSPPTPRVVLSADGTEAHFNQNLNWSFRLDVTAGAFEHLRSQGFGAVLDALGKSSSNRNEFEVLLLNALHWIADAERQEQLENRITSYVTGLEMFFSAQGSPIVRDVSEGVAYALGANLGERKRIRDLVTKLYGLRSKVSHEGRRSVVEAETRELKMLTINFLARMSRLSWRFSAKEHVSAWIADLRLSGTYADDPPMTGADSNSTAPGA